MWRVKFVSGNGAPIGGSHQAIRFYPDKDWQLIDYGIYPNYDPKNSKDLRSVLPFGGRPLVRNARNLFVTHSHVDHVAALPRLFGEKIYPDLETVYMTEEALDLSSRMIWRDSIAIADREGRQRPFEEKDINALLSRIRIVQPGEELRFEHFSAIPILNGHILGSVAWIFVPKNGANPVFVSGDFSVQPQELIRGIQSIPDRFSKFSLALIESTKLDEIGHNRERVKKTFVDFILRVLARGGQVLIPAFAIGRSPEIYALLTRNSEIQRALEAVQGSIYVDGSSAQAIKIYSRYVQGFKYSENHLVRDWDHTERLIESQKPMIVIASSGMLVEGSRSSFYAKSFLKRERNAIAIPGYQAPNTPGASLLDSRKDSMVKLDNQVFWRSCDVERFDFSAHCDGLESIDLQKRLNPEVTVLNHGDRQVIERFIRENQLGGNVRMAEIGRMVEV